MKVSLIGASGNAGRRILGELSERGHSVLALGRNSDNIPRLDGVEVQKVDANDVDQLSRLLAGSDAVISAAKFKDAEPAGLIEAVKKAGVRRYLVVGGAGSLEVEPGLREVDGPGFPAHVRPEALKGADFLEQLKVSGLDWTFLSPSRIFFEGSRTGRFRLGTDRLLFDENGKSSISFEDYAIAMVDELEQSKHVRARFTVGY